MKNKLPFFKLFFEVWIHPRKVIQTILDKESNYFTWPLVITYAILETSNPIPCALVVKILPLTLALLTGTAMSVFFTAIIFLFFSWSSYFLGKLMGGKATFAEIRTACAWAFPPAFFGTLSFSIVNVPLWIKILEGETSWASISSQPKMEWQIFFTGFFNLLILWALILWLINVAQAHRFSIWKSIAIGLVSSTIFCISFITLFYILLRIQI